VEYKDRHNHAYNAVAMLGAKGFHLSPTEFFQIENGHSVRMGTGELQRRLSKDAVILQPVGYQDDGETSSNSEQRGLVIGTRTGSIELGNAAVLHVSKSGTVRFGTSGVGTNPVFGVFNNGRIVREEMLPKGVEAVAANGRGEALTVRRYPRSLQSDGYMIVGIDHDYMDPKWARPEPNIGPRMPARDVEDYINRDNQDLTAWVLQGRKLHPVKVAMKFPKGTVTKDNAFFRLDDNGTIRMRLYKGDNAFWYTLTPVKKR
jgi:hypothetical protein